MWAGGGGGGGGGSHGRRRRVWAVEALEGRVLLAAAAAPVERGGAGRLSPVLARLADGGGAAALGFGAPAEIGGTGVGDGTLDRLTWDAAGRVGVTVTTRGDGRRLRRVLDGLGFGATASRTKLHLIEGYLPPAALRAAAGLSRLGLLGIVPTYRPLTRAGAVSDQGDFAEFADRVRNTLPAGFDGAGVTVGVISDSFNVKGGAAADIASGDLPAAGVQVIEEGLSTAIDEGRAMAQIVHDLAPGATILFATAAGGEAHFADNIRRLADAGATVIVDDIFYFNEPMFQDGIVAQAVDEVEARGVTYLSAAGNEASQSYESTNIRFTPAGPGGALVYDFDPGPGQDTRLSVTMGPGAALAVTLQWDDPFYTTGGVDTDLDLYVSQNGTRLFGGAQDNLASQRPGETVNVRNTSNPPTNVTFDLEIELFAGPAPQRLKLVNFNSPLRFNQFATNSPTTVGHAAARGVVSVGAVPWFDRQVPEAFTSLGPSTALFTAGGQRLGAPEVRNKPDVAGVDGADTTFFDGDADGNGIPEFFGTSAAAPHVAAIAALVRQAHPQFTPAQVRQRLIDAGDPATGAPGFDFLTGAGLVDAYRAVFGLPVAAPLPLADGFEVGGPALSAAWALRSTGAGRIAVTTADGPAQGARQLTLDSAAANRFSLNEAVLGVNAASLGAGELLLSFRQREFGDEDHPMAATFVGSGNFDGVAFSADGGLNWLRVVSLTGADSTDVYQDRTFNLTQIAAAAGVSLGSDVRIKFQQFDDNSIAGLDGMAFDDVRVAPAASAAPGRPDLRPASDSGASDADDLTNRNNAAPARSLQFDVPGTLGGALVTLFADGVAVASTFAGPGDTTTLTTDGALALADGVRAFTATQQVPGQAQSPPSPALPVTIDTAAPAVAAVTVAGSAWAPAFLAFLQSAGLGDGGGFAVPAGAQQLAVTRLWVNLNRIKLRFTESAVVGPGDLRVSGVNTPLYATPGFSYDPGTRTATWSLPTPLPADRVALSLGTVTAVSDAAGNALDGDWSDGAHAYPSGDGAPGGAFRFGLNVLPGDASGDGKVDALDLLRAKQSLLRSTSLPGTGAGAYAPTTDVNGDGQVSAADFAAIRLRIASRLPPPPGPPIVEALTATSSRFRDDPLPPIS